MKRKKLVIIFLATVLCGCGENNKSFQTEIIPDKNTDSGSTGSSELFTYEISAEEDDKDNEIRKYSFPESYTYEGEQLLIDIKLNVKDVYFRKAVMDGYEEFDSKKLCSFLLEGNEKEMPELENNVYYIDKDDPERICFLDNEMVNYTDGSVTKTYKSVYASESGETEGYYNLLTYKDPKTFSFGDAAESEEKLFSLLEDYGISTDDLFVNVYYLDHKTLSNEEKYFDVDTGVQVHENKKNWDEGDDMYLFYFHQYYCGLDVLPSFRQNGIDASEDKCPIIAYCGRKGIDGLYIKKPVLREETGYYEFKDFEDIAEALKERYEYPIDDYTYEIYRAKLICDIDENKELRPVWNFYAIATNKAGTRSEWTIKVDAVSGRLWYS